jgi:enoyl-[acyl-carrier-protein] reductase (NADH)
VCADFGKIKVSFFVLHLQMFHFIRVLPNLLTVLNNKKQCLSLRNKAAEKKVKMYENMEIDKGTLFVDLSPAQTNFID